MPKRPGFDPLNILIADLDIGFFLDYNFKSFEITDGIEVKIKDYCIRVMKLDASDQQLWLMVENETSTALAERLDAALVNNEIPSIMENFGKAPATLEFRDVKYKLISAGDGRYRDLKANAMDWNRASGWKYGSSDGGQLLYITQMGLNVFEAIIAIRINPAEFSNFLPSVK